ncbi:MAG: squalene-hopene/tetraprenyl-beta-curcumene cyclase, partial [Candidatus Paceibacteria bacterium]
MSGAASVDRMRHQARERLLAERTQGGWWKGELSSSALSTATACAALALARTEGDDRYLAPGLTWLAQHQNGDGGYGDTTCSPSNLSTSALCWMALGFGQSDSHRRAKQSVEQWLSERLGGLQPEDFASGLREVYAEDHTFAIPILVACTVGGAFPQHQSPWSSIARLPFELAALPRGLFKWLGLSVVSYALPALIAIGQAIEYHNPSRNPFSRLLRRVTRSSTLRTLESIQPPGGGFLEATPLTSFVVLSLVSCGHTKHPVVLQGLDFLRRSIRSDGSWPIDSDLATWLTTLAVNALCAAGDQDEALSKAERRPLSKWLMGQQHVTLHPYTGAAPGGWAWTDLPGGVPDADDTAGALLALQELGSIDSARAKAGALWLRDLQNRDGGIPTFCRGWGKLPFDASCPDLTAHALRAWLACEKPLLVGGDRETVIELGEARQRAQEHLVRTQQGDGTWTPLWFGNQQATNKENP